MPYIPSEDRFEFILKREPKNAGELNWLLSEICNKYYERYGVSYQTLNDVHGVLACMQMEIYRRLTAKYEDVKIAKNGDINFPSYYLKYTFK